MKDLLLFRLHAGLRASAAVRFGLIDAQAHHQPAVLLRGDSPGFARAARPLKAAGLQTFVQQHKTVALPVQGFYPVAASAAEQKQGVGEWIKFELLLNNCVQPVNSAAQICIAAGDVNPICSCKIVQHDLRISTSSFN